MSNRGIARHVALAAAGIAVALAALTACSGGGDNGPDFAACNKLATAFANGPTAGPDASVFTEIAKIGASTKTPLGTQLTKWAADAQTRIAAGQTPQKSTAFGTSIATQCQNAGVLVPDE